MGCYDTFIDGEESEQCKAFNDTDLRVFKVGDVVPEANGRSITVCLPGDGFIVISRGKFVRITNNIGKTVGSYLSKWGDAMTREQAKARDMYNPYAVTSLCSSDVEVTTGDKSHAKPIEVQYEKEEKKQ